MCARRPSLVPASLAQWSQTVVTSLRATQATTASAKAHERMEDRASGPAQRWCSR